MSPKRAFESAWLVVPENFPASCATVRLSKDAVLRIPHIESDGKLCFDGDPGPACDVGPVARLEEMLHLFNEKFYEPWLAGNLDEEFEAECRTYWQIWIGQRQSKLDAIWRVYTVNERPAAPRVISARLILPDRTLVVDDERGIANNLIASISSRASQMMRAYVADIPLEFPWTPLTWPKKVNDIDQLLQLRLGVEGYREFENRKKHHRVVLFRSPNCSHAYLLPNGPKTVIARGRSKFAVSTRALLPLNVERVDPSWTYGRDQIPEVTARQRKHVLVLGAGALASPVIDQLARAGLGKISIVDPQVLTGPNIGRHLLGAESLYEAKAVGVAKRLTRAHPACRIEPYAQSAERWLLRHGLKGIDAVLDLTGEPDVRVALELARNVQPIPLLVGWLEPFVAAAHAVCLPVDVPWLQGGTDPLLGIQAVVWPPIVVQREPGCNSEFQSYTPSQASYAVSLVAEAALMVIDAQVAQPKIRSWVRGQQYLDRQHPGLALQGWAKQAAMLDGVLIERPWNE